MKAFLLIVLTFLALNGFSQSFYEVDRLVFYPETNKETQLTVLVSDIISLNNSTDIEKDTILIESLETFQGYSVWHLEVPELLDVLGVYRIDLEWIGCCSLIESRYFILMDDDSCVELPPLENYVCDVGEEITEYLFPIQSFGRYNAIRKAIVYYDMDNEVEDASTLDFIRWTGKPVQDKIRTSDLAIESIKHSDPFIDSLIREIQMHYKQSVDYDNEEEPVKIELVVSGERTYEDEDYLFIEFQEELQFSLPLHTNSSMMFLMQEGKWVSVGLEAPFNDPGYGENFDVLYPNRINGEMVLEMDLTGDDEYEFLFASRVSQRTYTSEVHRIYKLNHSTLKLEQFNVAAYSEEELGDCYSFYGKKQWLNILNANRGLPVINVWTEYIECVDYQPVVTSWTKERFIWDAYTEQVVPFEDHTFNYDSSFVITGILTLEDFYGPPGYGEDPESDKIFQSWVLHLDQAINVIELSSVTTMNSTVEEVETVQFNAANFNLELYEGTTIRLKGEFYSPHTGWHQERLLMTVEELVVAK